MGGSAHSENSKDWAWAAFWQAGDHTSEPTWFIISSQACSILTCDTHTPSYTDTFLHTHKLALFVCVATGINTETMQHILTCFTSLTSMSRMSSITSSSACLWNKHVTQIFASLQLDISLRQAARFTNCLQWNVIKSTQINTNLFLAAPMLLLFFFFFLHIYTNFPNSHIFLGKYTHIPISYIFLGKYIYFIKFHTFLEKYCTTCPNFHRNINILPIPIYLWRNIIQLVAVLYIYREILYKFIQFPKMFTGIFSDSGAWPWEAAHWLHCHVRRSKGYHGCFGYYTVLLFLYTLIHSRNSAYCKLA